VAGAALVSTITVVLVQPLASKAIIGLRTAAWSVAAASIVAGIAMLALASAAGHSPGTSTAFIAAAAILLALAEVAQVVGTLTLAYTLAPGTAHGSYQGVFSLSPGLAFSAGPLLLSVTVLTHGLPAWAALAAVIALAGSSVPLVTGTSALRGRHRGTTEHEGGQR